MRKKKTQKKKKQKRANNSSQKYVIDWEGIIIVSVVTGLFAGSFIFNGSSGITGLIIGLFMAFVGLPYFNPKKWKPRPLLCGVLGAALGCGLAIASSATLMVIVMSGIAGLLIGLFALHWVPYISLP